MSLQVSPLVACPRQGVRSGVGRACLWGEACLYTLGLEAGWREHGKESQPRACVGVCGSGVCYRDVCSLFVVLRCTWSCVHGVRRSCGEAGLWGTLALLGQWLVTKVKVKKEEGMVLRSLRSRAAGLCDHEVVRIHRRHRIGSRGSFPALFPLSPLACFPLRSVLHLLLFRCSFSLCSCLLSK